MTSPNTVVFTKEKVESLRKRWRQALDNGEEEFEWEDKLFVTAYAGWLLKYLDQEMK